MFIYQEGKLYVWKSEMLVGVNVTLSDVVEIPSVKVKLKDDYLMLTMSEVKLKFGINEIDKKSYKFPQAPKRSRKKSTTKASE